MGDDAEDEEGNEMENARSVCLHLLWFFCASSFCDMATIVCFGFEIVFWSNDFNGKDVLNFSREYYIWIVQK